MSPSRLQQHGMDVEKNSCGESVFCGVCQLSFESWALWLMEITVTRRMWFHDIADLVSFSSRDVVVGGWVLPELHPCSPASWLPFMIFLSPNTRASYCLPNLGILHNPSLTSYLDLSLTSANYLRQCYLTSAAHGWGKLREFHTTLITDYLRCVQSEIQSRPNLALILACQ